MNYPTIDYRKSVEPKKDDFGHLSGIARQLVGERVLFGCLSYPRELTIHFGTPITVKGPRGRTWSKGTYTLTTIGAVWEVKSAKQGKRVADFSRLERANSVSHGGDQFTEEQVEEFLSEIGGATVHDVTLALTEIGVRLDVVFSDGSYVAVFPTTTHLEIGTKPEYDFMVDPPDWELFTPYGLFLKVGPGRQWSYQPSNQPEKIPS
ncbi:MAG: hypothetical protein MUF18_18455 [Fimbriiglobus sp.]|nr:hypothetical protein [Fimbriiglobus sp.]